jgi:hypothetical protein
VFVSDFAPAVDMSNWREQEARKKLEAELRAKEEERKKHDALEHVKAEVRKKMFDVDM